VITGRTGRERIYDGYPDVSLEMVDSRTFDGRLQLLEYVPTVLSGLGPAVVAVAKNIAEGERNRNSYLKLQ
jgi:hypothetical protein